MGLEKINGRSVYAVEALICKRKGDQPIKVKFGILPEQLGRFAARGEINAIAQFYMVVEPELVHAKHLFRGLERPLFCNNDMQADEKKLIYSWKPEFDYEWKGDRFSGETDSHRSPYSKVFVVICAPNTHKDFPGVDGWVEHWSWVIESDVLMNAPIDHQTRYKEHLWSDLT